MVYHVIERVLSRFHYHLMWGDWQKCGMARMDWSKARQSDCVARQERYATLEQAKAASDPPVFTSYAPSAFRRRDIAKAYAKYSNAERAAGRKPLPPAQWLSRLR